MCDMKKRFGIPPLVFAFVLLPFAVLAANPLSADGVVAKADEIRSPQLDYTVGVTVRSVRRGGPEKVSTYEVLVKGKDKTIIKTLSPDIDRGRTLLMLGRDLWAFLPDVSKPIRISLQQRLVGEVANGDIARVNFSGDYDAAFMEKGDGDREYYVLELKAKSDDVTYNRVVYRVRADDYRPVSAEFYAVSGRLIKTCSYEDYSELAGRMRPAKLVLQDPLAKDNVSTIEYRDMEVSPLPAKYFSKDYMKKLKY